MQGDVRAKSDDCKTAGKPREVQVLYAATRLTAYAILANIRGYTCSRVSESCNIRVFMCSRVSYVIYAATRAAAYVFGRAAGGYAATRLAAYIS